MMNIHDKKKILFVANLAKEHILKFHVPTIKRLVDLGWTVHVACAGTEAIPYCHKQFVLSYKRSPFNFALFKGIKELKKIVNEENYDIVYCHTPVGGMAARFASRQARKRGTKVVYMAHGYYFFKGASFLSWVLCYPMEKMMAKMADVSILINKEDYELTLKKFKVSQAYLINGIGVDLNRFQMNKDEEIIKKYRTDLNIPQDAKVLIYLAELVPNKNQKFLMRVLKQLLRKGEKYYLVLPGIDHSRGAFQKYAKKIGVADHVRFLGWRDDVVNLYQMADICVASSKREGLPINLIEAMSCGVPIVAVYNRGHSSIIGNGSNGFLVRRGDEDAFAEKVETLCNNEDLYNAISKKAHDECYKFGNEIIIDNILKVFSDL